MPHNSGLNAAMRLGERQSIARMEHRTCTQRVLIGCKPPQIFPESWSFSWTQAYRQRPATHWVPRGWREPPLVLALRGPRAYFPNEGSLPRYAGHVPGLMFRNGERYNISSRLIKNVLECDHT